MNRMSRPTMHEDIVRELGSASYLRNVFFMARDIIGCGGIRAQGGVAAFALRGVWLYSRSGGCGCIRAQWGALGTFLGALLGQTPPNDALRRPARRAPRLSCKGIYGHFFPAPFWCADNTTES